MGPLALALASLLGSVVVDALRSRSRLGEHYPDSAAGRLDRGGWVPMRGKKVTWWIDQGKAVWIDAKYVQPRAGNIFHKDKLGAVARTIRKATEPVDFYASWGQIQLVDPEVVADSIVYSQWEPVIVLTTGDAELDAFLVNTDEWLADRADEADREALRETMQARLARAVETGSGDLGKWRGTVFDGNHRVFGAILAGEERIPIRISDNDFESLREGIRRRKLSSEQRALIEKMAVDTGHRHPQLEEGWTVQGEHVTPSQLRDRSSRMDEVDPAHVGRLVAMLDELRFPLRIHRGLHVPPGASFDPLNVRPGAARGGHWTWHRDVAEAFARGTHAAAGDGEPFVLGSTPWLLSAELPNPKAVDWVGTLDLAIGFTDPGSPADRGEYQVVPTFLPEVKAEPLASDTSTDKIWRAVGAVRTWKEAFDKAYEPYPGDGQEYPGQLPSDYVTIEEEDTRQMARAAELEVLGWGAGRIVFDLGDGTVVKVAHRGLGEKANLDELEIWARAEDEQAAYGDVAWRELLFPVLGGDETAIVMEKAERRASWQDEDAMAEVERAVEELHLVDGGDLDVDLLDLESYNWGFLRGRWRLMDYGG
jgi:hypothetical protein